MQIKLRRFAGLRETPGVSCEHLALPPISGALVIHRIVSLQVCNQIVLTALAARHRSEAFAACEFVMGYLKTEAPFWKKETTGQGAHWVKARASDAASLAKRDTIAQPGKQ